MTRGHTLRLVLLSFVVATVAAAMARPAAAGGGGCHDAHPTEAAGVTVEMAGSCMSPTVLRVDPGTSVTFTNHDPFPHNLYGLAWSGGTLEPGASVAHTFAEAGSYPYACLLHPGMVGTVVVGEGSGTELAAQPVAALTADDDGDTSAMVLLVGVGGIALATASFVAGARIARRPAS